MSDIINEFINLQEDEFREKEKERIQNNNLERKEKRLLTKEELLYIVDFLTIDPHMDWEIAINQLNSHIRLIFKEIYNKKVYLFTRESSSGEDDDSLQRIRNAYEKDYNDSRLHAGTMVGAIAAGSIGEPSTQMTLNSLDYNEYVMLLKNEKEVIVSKIGEFIDNLMNENIIQNVFSEKGTPTQYVEINNYCIPSVDENGKMWWKKVEAITRHPPVDKDGNSCKLIKVSTKSGRSVIATPAKSFLIVINNVVIPINGSELKIGDKIPITKQFPTIDTELYEIEYKNNIINLDSDFGYLIGVYISEGLDNSDFLNSVCKLDNEWCIPSFCFISNKPFLLGLLQGYLNSSNKNSSILINQGLFKIFNIFGLCSVDETLNDVGLDEIIKIEELDSSHEFVYDFTVEDTRNFEAYSGINIRDSFHSAGSLSTAVVYGVPRLEEIMSATKKPKKTSLTFKLFEDEKMKLYKNDEFKYIQYLRNLGRRTFEEKYIYDFIESCDIKSNRDISNDEWYIFFNEWFHEDYKEYNWSIRLKFKKSEIYDYQLNLRKISEKIEIFGDTRCVFSPNHIGIIDVYVDTSNLNTVEDIVKRDKKNLSCNLRRLVDNPEYYFIRDVALNHIKFIQVCGVKDIDMLYFIKTNSEWSIQTVGSNLQEILTHPLVNFKTLETNFWWEGFRILGIEACRTIFKNELVKTFNAGGITVNDCHLDLLIDSMTSRGTINPASRYGTDDIGPLTRSSFEMSSHNMLDAARHAENDQIKGVSSSIIVGKMAKIGTGYMDLLPNIKMLNSIKEDNENEYEAV